MVSFFSKKNDNEKSINDENIVQLSSNKSIDEINSPKKEEELSTQIPKEEEIPNSTDSTDSTNEEISNPFENTENKTDELEKEKENLYSSIENNLSNDTLSKDEIKDLVDETIEKVIAEKWENILDKVNIVTNWKDSAEKTLTNLNDELKKIKGLFESFDEKISKKINTYDLDLLNISAEIKGLEKVFQKIGPSLMNNISQLDGIVKDFKKIKKDN